MTSTIPLHAGPAAGFDEPFEMLDACHRRVERMLELLDRLAAHLPLYGADDQAQQAATDVMRYFDLAAPHHHEDEERHLLPCLRARGHQALAARLQADHQRMAQAWAHSRGALLEISRGRCDGSSALAWSGLATIYREHIALEDHLAFPRAREAIDAAGLREMGREMAQRRGAV